MTTTATTTRTVSLPATAPSRPLAVSPFAADLSRLRRGPSKDESEPSLDLRVNRVLVGDALRRLRTMPNESVDTVVTSPPYFMLRNYQAPGQLGLEDSVGEWVQQLLTVLTEVHRVLKPSGSVWLNLGDTYARHPRHGALPKGLVLAPERLLVALSDAGWRVRNKVVWAKPNPMPAAVRDRLATTWEPLYLLTKERHYYFDLDTIRVPARTSLGGPSVAGSATKYGAGTKASKRPEWSGPLAGSNVGLERMKATGQSSHPLGKNPGDVWTIPTANYRGAHFATFPERLIEKPLRATCPERVCRNCGIPWQRPPLDRTAQRMGALAVMATLRKSCSCSNRAWQPGLVLDPFMGAGTVGVVAERLHRRWLGVELNPSFARQAQERITAARGRYEGQAA